MPEKAARSYLPKMKHCILTFLRKRYDEQEAQSVFERVQQLEETYRREESYIGNKDNMMADNLYQAYCMFALYEAMNRRMTNDDMQELIDTYFAQATARLPKKLNLSGLVRSKLCAGAIYWYIGRYAARANAKKGKEWGNTWGIKVNPDNRKTGLAVNLVGCPLADFAHKHNMMEILPALCNIDHKTVGTLGLKLFRDKTVSNGDTECVYWVVPGKSAEADTFVNEQNSNGLILSRMKVEVERSIAP